MLADARPLLAVVASARIARKPEPETDWRCVRPPHQSGSDTVPAGISQQVADSAARHVAMPLGITGPTIQFSDAVAEPSATRATPTYADALAAYHDLLTSYRALIACRDELIATGTCPAELATPTLPLPPHQG
jgi:hypothetical protein